MPKYYTGVGGRKTPENILRIMEQIATQLAKQGWTLRSGGARDADSAFERGAGHLKQIFYAKDATPKAMHIAALYHPAWDRCSGFARRLHGRNSFQVLGPDLKTPSRFLICWTPDGCITHAERQYATGGTGTAISIASHYDVEVFNLAREDHLDRIKKVIYE